jgi:hypothetical protein
MLFPDILAQLNTLPDTFLRPGQTFSWIQTTKTAALDRYTSASDGLVAQLSFANAYGVWLDCWGKLFAIPRQGDESDDQYFRCIPATLQAGRGTPVSIELFLLIAYGYNVTVVEDFTNVAWQVKFSVPITPAQFTNVMQRLNHIRPAGVPATALIGLSGGLYLGTVNYLNAPRVTGAYLLSPQGVQDFEISAYTNNTQPLLPTLFLTDPTINPGLV